MMQRRWRDVFGVVVGAVLCLLPTLSWAGPPPQKLPSALLVFPLIQYDGSTDTRVEVVNLSGLPQQLECFYVESELCNETGFLVWLTPYQPIAWLASDGFSNTVNGSAVPPFFGTGELKCVVVPPPPGDIDTHNAIQGRATVYGLDGKTVSYGAVGFQRIANGEFTGTVQLDGATYAQCPDKLHFDVIADTATATSDMILLPCRQDLLLQIPTSINVQFLITNEFEQTFSTSINVKCFDRRRLGEIADSLVRANLGSDTAHVSIRGTSGPLLGLVVDGVEFGGKVGTAGNEPSFQGGRSATVFFP